MSTALEYNENFLRQAESRLKNGQVFRTLATTFDNGNKTTKRVDALLFYKDGDYVLLQNGEETRRVNSLFSVVCPLDEEMMYVVQDWGVSGETHKETLLTENCEDDIKYEGVDNTLIGSFRSKENRADTLSLLKKHCAPSQSLVLVKNLHCDFESNEYAGETEWESNDFAEMSEYIAETAVSLKEAEAE